jgi:SAM-dependent methyltransferase
MKDNDEIEEYVGLPCAVCGGNIYRKNSILWPELILSWEISDREVEYINEQQGTICIKCGSNIRSIALSKAICLSQGYHKTLEQFLEDGNCLDLSLLEVNEAGTLHTLLRRFQGHVFASYPEFDLMKLPFESDQFDLVVHSDTLEHVPDPCKGLREIWRILRPNGATIFTVPIIVGRMNRYRTSLPPIYHGNSKAIQDDLLVYTEFGADIWVMVCQAGFSRCEFVTFKFPAGIALIATK